MKGLVMFQVVPPCGGHQLLLYGNILLVVTAVPTVENARLFDFQLLAPLRLRRVLCRFSRQQRHPLLTIDLQ